MLLELFFKHGALLVLKSDNGSAFIAEDTEDLLTLWGVVHLLSPARTPRSNGAADVMMQWIKAWTVHAACSAGHGPVLRPEDFAHALQVANEVGGQESRSMAPRSAAWQQRPTMGNDMRRALAQTVEAKERDLSAALGQPRGARTLAKIRRDAIGHALVAHGFLRIRRRPMTLRELMCRTARTG